MTTLSRDGLILGRPSNLTPALISKAEDYLNGAYLDAINPLPSALGLALYLGIGTPTLYEYGKRSIAIANILTQLKLLQHETLIAGGLSGAYNASIAKLILGKHGYSDRAEQIIEHTTNSDSIKPALFVGVNSTALPEPFYGDLVLWRD